VNTDINNESCFLYVISTGRCGTQWLASTLNKIYSDCAVVEHEPLGPEYRLKETLRCPRRLTELASKPPLLEHLAYIDDTLRYQTYIETGGPAIAAVPLFIERYGSRMRLIHIVRHPVIAAISALTINFYQRKKDDPWRLCELEPSDTGVIHKHYQKNWSQLTAYEKCLFHWLEVNTWAEEIKHNHPEIPLLTIRMEDMFSDQGSEVMDAVLEFTKLPQHPDITRLLTERVDNVSHPTLDGFRWQYVMKYPEVLELARHYSYDFEGLDNRQLRYRYQAPLHKRLRKYWKQWKKRLRAKA
jgi:hypothetical protein